MRYLFGFMCVLALGVMPMVGCGETEGTGGSGGSAASGGSAGTGGMGGGGTGGAGGMGGGGTGGTDLCEGIECDDGNECTDDVCVPADGCEYTPVEGGTVCGGDAGTCQQGSCRVACDEQGILDAIAAGGGPYTFDCGSPMTVMTDAEIVIGNDVILNGEGNLTVDGGGSHGVFSVGRGVTAELHSLTVSGGTTASYGDGISNNGTLTLTNSTVRGNGGGIYNDFGSRLTLTNSTVSGNDGFGIANLGYATLTNSTISGNSEGSLVVVCMLHFLIDCGWFRLINSTVSGNTACLSDIGFECDEPDRLSFATWTHTVIDGVCPETWIAVSNGYNIESPGNTCGLTGTGDQVSITEELLNLGPLQDNGGPTETRALLPGSVAIDVIPVDMCEVDEDQRGEPRDSMCDVGAFEVQP